MYFQKRRWSPKEVNQMKRDFRIFEIILFLIIFLLDNFIFTENIILHIVVFHSQLVLSSFSDWENVFFLQLFAYLITNDHGCSNVLVIDNNYILQSYWR